MFKTQGLSLDQAPPLWVVFSFFAAGALWGMLGSLLFVIDRIFDLHVHRALFVHLWALGFMAHFMIGALFQMLPVIAGVKISAPKPLALFTLLFLNLGVLFYLLAFYTKTATWFVAASTLLGLTFVVIVVNFSYLLIAKAQRKPTPMTMLFALIALGVTTVLGVIMLLFFGGVVTLHDLQPIKWMHRQGALHGWVGLLIVAVAYQVIEMFYVAPPYPKTFVKLFVPTLFTAILLSWFAPQVASVATIAYALFGFVTLWILWHKKRPVWDASAKLWVVAMVLLILSSLAATIEPFVNLKLDIPLHLMMFGLFATTVVVAMEFKIIPFLTWFHLSAQGYMDAPMMHEIIPAKVAGKHIYLHVALVVSVPASPLYEPLMAAAAFLALIDALLMLRHLFVASYKYLYTQHHGTRFEMQ